MSNDQAAEHQAHPISVAPLRKRTESGELYQRPASVVTAITTLRRLSPGELIARARINDPEHPDYTPTECLLYFVRRTSPGANRTLHDLFLVLRKRVLDAVPMPARRQADRVIDLEVQERVLDAFQELLCIDKNGYEDRLDYYECRFNSALATLRTTARRAVYRRHRRLAPLPAEDMEGNLPPVAEAWLEASICPPGEEEERLLYRSRLNSAISLLPPDERRVIDLLLEGYLIDSQDAKVVTITRILGCTEKTVRNRRNRAITTLRAAMEEEES